MIENIRLKDAWRPLERVGLKILSFFICNMLTFILFLIALFAQASSFASLVEGFYWDQQK